MIIKTTDVAQFLFLDYDTEVKDKLVGTERVG